MESKKTPLRLKLLLASVAVCLLAVVVYGASQWLFSSPSIQYESLRGEVQLSTNGIVWGSNNISVLEGQSWYARYYCTGTAKGNVSITWTLQKFDGVSWVDTNIIQLTKLWPLKGTEGQLLYVREYSGDSGNFDWGTALVDAQPGERYRVKAEFETI